MKQIEGQINLQEFIKSETAIHGKTGCTGCICERCLYWLSQRCPYGKCYDSLREKERPYDKEFPDKPPRTAWSGWKGQQGFWCRGGVTYLTHFCEHYEKYAGSSIEDCHRATIQIFQDGYFRCSLKETIGCEACLTGQENTYACQYMTDTGCELMFKAKSQIMEAVLRGEDLEMCREQCCIWCTKSCAYRCGKG